jgi:hypothetical protein
MCVCVCVCVCMYIYICKCVMAKAQSAATSRNERPLLPSATEISQSPKYVILYEQVGVWAANSRHGSKKVAKKQILFFLSLFRSSSSI